MVRCPWLSIPFLLLFPLATVGDAQRRTAVDRTTDLLAARYIGGAIGESLGSAVESVAKLGHASAEFNAQIAEHRREFWSQYPNGPRRRQAEAGFAKALLAKDLFHAAFAIYGNDPVARAFLAVTAIDGGIPTFARAEFHAWVEEMQLVLAVDPNRVRGSRNPGRAGPEISLTALLEEFPAILANAAAGNSKAYNRYREARDWAEFARAGRTPDLTPREYVSALTRVYRPHAAGMAEPGTPGHPGSFLYDVLSGVVGEGPLDALVRELMKAPKNPENAYLSPGAMKALQLIPLTDTPTPVPEGWTVSSDSPLNALLAIVNRSSDRAFLRTEILDGTFLEGKVDRATTLHAMLVAAYGEPALLAAAERFRTAPKMTSARMRWRLADQAAVGVDNAAESTPMNVFIAHLTRTDPLATGRLLTAYSLCGPETPLSRACADAAALKPLLDAEFAKFMEAGPGRMRDAVAQFCKPFCIWLGTFWDTPFESEVTRRQRSAREDLTLQPRHVDIFRGFFDGSVVRRADGTFAFRNEPSSGPAALKPGMSVDEVKALLGEPREGRADLVFRPAGGNGDVHVMIQIATGDVYGHGVYTPCVLERRIKERAENRDPFAPGPAAQRCWPNEPPKDEAAPLDAKGWELRKRQLGRPGFEARAALFAEAFGQPIFTDVFLTFSLGPGRGSVEVAFENGKLRTFTVDR